MKKEISRETNKRKGNKKISLLLVLRALERSSDANNLIKQVELAKMVNAIGEHLDLNISCDRKTVGRHLKLLVAAGYNIVNEKEKGYYIKRNEFSNEEKEFLVNMINSHSCTNDIKTNLINKLNLQQLPIDKNKIKQILNEGDIK